MTFQVPPGQTGAATVVVTNVEEDDDDRGELVLTVKNEMNTN